MVWLLQRRKKKGVLCLQREGGGIEHGINEQDRKRWRRRFQKNHTEGWAVRGVQSVSESDGTHASGGIGTRMAMGHARSGCKSGLLLLTTLSQVTPSVTR